MSDGRRLRLARGLRGDIPKGFPCKASCFECCKTPVQMLRVEWEHIKTLPVYAELEGLPDDTILEIASREPSERELVVISTKEGWCPFIDKTSGACRIYEERPLTCRLYGQMFFMPCQEGVECPPELEVKMVTIERWRRLTEIRADSIPWRSEEEARALAKAIQEWRVKNNTRRAVPPESAHDEVRKRAEEILGRPFK